MNSPFGELYPIIEKTGWSLHRIMEKESWIKLQLIMADAPGVKMIKKKSGTSNGKAPKKKGLLSK